MKYIILNDDKKPVEKLTTGGHSRAMVEDLENLGVLIPEPFVVLDFDSASDAAIIMEIVEALEVKCMVMQTTRGVHLWFTAPKPMKNSIKTRCAIGLHYDVRSYGKLCYTVVKKDGVWREWLQTYPADELDELPAWLRPVSWKTSFKGLKDGDGRNQMLYEYILILQSRNYTKEEIRQTIRIINDHVFEEGLAESEIALILRDEAFKDEADIIRKNPVSGIGDEVFFDDEGKFKHNVFAEALVENMRVITVNEQPYIYVDSYYQRAERELDRRMIEVYAGIRKVQRAEVIDYVKILTHTKIADITQREYVINLQNTLYDVREGVAIPFDAEVVDFCRIPVVYDPAAYCADLDKMLNKVFCHDREVIDLFEEIVGYMLIKNCRFRKGFLFYGGGSNGKSTVLNLLKKFIGEDNCATIELEKLSDRFKTAELENKLLNVGDDINKRDIRDTGTIKKLFTGESVTVERKNQAPFTLKSYAKMIFSCNELPHIADKSHGMYSRLMLVPFTATFSADDDDFDPFIEDKITTPEALSYLLNMGLRGLRRLLHKNQFTQPAVVIAAMEGYVVENSTSLLWIAEEGLTVRDLTGTTTDELYSNFSDWCNRNNIRNTPTLRTFHKEIEDKYKLERRRIRNSTTGMLFKFKFEVKL